MSGPLQLALVSFKKGSYIIVEGKRQADRFYIIRTGKVQVNKEAEIVAEEGGNILVPGDFFGVVATMSGHSHIETAQAVEDVTLITVQTHQYGYLIEKNTPVAMKIIHSFSKRVRYLDEALTRLTFKNTAAIDEEHLFDVGEYYVKQNSYNHAYFAYYQYVKGLPQGENAAKAKARLTKIKPYAKNVIIPKENSGDFNRTYPGDAMIFCEGQTGDELYIIQRGQVKITKIVDNNEVLLALLKPGDIFGEMALLENKPRSASAITHEECIMLAINRANFERMVQSQPQIVARLTTLLADRIWLIYKQLANTLIDDPLGRLYDAMLIQLEKNKVNINDSSYTFDFGAQELINMVGLSKGEGKLVIHKLFQEGHARLVNEKIFIKSIREIEKQARYYAKMARIARERRQNARR